MNGYEISALFCSGAVFLIAFALTIGLVHGLIKGGKKAERNNKFSNN